MGDEGHSGKDTIPIWLDCDPGTSLAQSMVKLVLIEHSER